MPRKLVTKLITVAIESYHRLVIRLENKWAHHHPSSFRNYTTFKSGLHSTLLDINDLLRLWTKLSFDNRSILQCLPVMTQRELYVLRQVPRDLLRLSPVLLLAPLPGTVFLLPFFFAYPYVFLNRAFWTEKQRSEYDSKQLVWRLSVPRNELIHSLHQTTEKLKKSPGVSVATVQRLSALDELLDKLRSSRMPLHRELIAASSVFDDQLTLDKLSKVHVFNLCRLHGLPVRTRLSMFTRWPCTRIYLEPKYFHFRRLRLLRFRASLLSCEDRLVHRTMIQYSGTVAPPLAELRDLCHLRGIEVNSDNTDQAWDLLKQWTYLSLSASESNHSFRLHLPIFLAQQAFIAPT